MAKGRADVTGIDSNPPVWARELTTPARARIKPESTMLNARAGPNP